MPEGSNYSDWRAACRYNGVPVPYEDDAPKEKPEEITADIPLPDGVIERRPGVIYHILKGKPRTAIGRMSTDNFEKLKSGEWGASPLIRAAVKDCVGINLPETQRPVMIISVLETLDGYLGN